MHKLLLIFLITITFLKTAFAQQPDPDFLVKTARNESRNFLQKKAFKENQNYGLYDLVYQRMEWQVDPAVRYIKGNVTSYFKSKTIDFSEIVFDLQEDMTVDSIISNTKKINFRSEQNKLIIPLENNLQENQMDSVTVYYQGIPSESGFGSFATETHAGTPVMWTLSEPYGAMEWWPCKQSLSDKIDSIDVIVTCPEMYKTASNGILVSDTVKGFSREMHWKHRYPIATYLVAIAVTNYATYSDFLEMNDGRKIEILNYVYPENLAKAKEETPRTLEIMQLYNQIIGEYPFAREKYGHAQFGWGGGMEHQTMSFMFSFGFELVAHELAHQWFGDCITLASWHDIWLNEGFATYMTGLAYENLLNDNWWPVWKKVNLELIKSVPNGSVYVQDTTNVSRIFSSRLSYSKGAYLLHMLRWVLGDEDFFNGLRSYFKDPEVSFAFAQNKNLISHMESAGDTSLTEFFNDWYYGEGYPVYSLRYSQTSTNNINLLLSQTTSHPSVDFFEMPVHVRMYNSGITDSIDFRLINTKNNQEFQVNPGFEVAKVKIDPDNWLIADVDETVKTPLLETEDDIVVFPNPFHNNFSVYIPAGQKLLSAALYNIQGNKVAEFNNNLTEINTTDLPKGIYFIKINTSKDEFEKKIIKH